jgi:uncharacterized GH25 family protein/5-hydroxyisourate hydrolase-like protein (transthyretin family)
MKTLAITAVALLLSAASAAAAITGMVSDPNGAPLAGVTLRAFAVETTSARAARLMAGNLDREPLASAQTSENGSFRIDKAGVPVVDLVLSAAGRETITRSTADGEDLTLVLRELKPRKLRVVANGKPVANAIVSVSRAIAIRTAADGTFELRVPAARTISIYQRDIAPAEAPVTRTDTDVKVDSGTSLTGRVVGADDKPVSGAAILVGIWPLAKSGDDGSFTIAHAPRGWRELYAIAGDRIAVAARGATSAYTLKLRAGVKVTGTVRDDKSRTPVAGMLLRFPFAEVITDSAGAFTFSPVIAGRYPFSGSHPLYAMTVRDLVVPTDGSKEAFAATLLPLLSGTVVDEQKKPVAAAFVARPSMFPLGDSLSTYTRRDGTFSVRGSLGAPFARTPFSVSKEGFVDSDFSVADGQSKSGISVVLRRGIPLVVRVIDTEKLPVSGSLVRIAPSERGSEGPREVRCGGSDCVTASDGSVTVNVAPAKYDISVWSSTAVTKQLPAQNIDARTGPITITVQRGVDVAGRVTYTDGTPITTASMVRVTLEAQGAMPMTNAMEPDGTFVFHNAPRGVVTVRPEVFESSRYIGASKEVTAPVTNVVLTVPRGGRISGHVVDASSGQPITDFELLVQRTAAMFAGGAPRTIHADDGTFTINDVMPGRIELTATAEGYTRGSASGIDMAEGAAVPNVELRLERAARVKGRVTSTDGQPIIGARVMSMEPGRRIGPLDANVTDADGNYVLASVAPGERNITFSKEGYVATTKSVDAAAGKESRLDATLDRGRELTGRVLDDSGQPVAAAEVRVEGEPMRPIQTDSDGAFHLTGLREGRVRLFAHKNGYADARDEADTTTTSNVTLTLGRGATISGHITGLTDAEMATATVSFFGNATYGSTRPDAAGNFALTGVRDGKVTVEASVGMQSRRSARKVIEVANGSAPLVDLAFVAGSTVKGRVLARGRTLSDYSVTFSAVDPQQPPGSSRIDSEGNYSVAGLGTGAYRITIFAPMAGMIHSEKFAVNGDTVHDIELHTLVVRGRVTDTEGKPLADTRIMAEVVKREAGSPPPRSAMTDSDGRYVIDFVSDGQWRISAQKEKYQPVSRETQVSDGMPDVDLQLTEASKSSVRVVDMRDGSPVLANVSAIQNGRAAYTTQTRASDGVADLYLAPGHYTISVSAQHYARTTSQIDVPGPEVRIPLGRGATIVVVAPEGSRVRLVGGGTTFVVSTNHFDNIPAGAYTAQLLGPDNKPVASKPVQAVEGQTVTVALP